MAARQTVLIDLTDVVKSYGRNRVVDIDKLIFSSGQTVLLQGQNASGKSTLLRILAGISTLDTGRIHYHPVLQQRRLGYLPQAGGLYPDLTVRENLNLRRKLSGLDSVSLDNFWYVSELGLEPFLDRRAVQLSGGFSRLAAISATLHSEPNWLLLDEPLSGVDDRAREVLRKHFASNLSYLDLCIITAPTGDVDLGMGHRIEMRGGRVT